VEHKIDSGNVN